MALIQLNFESEKLGRTVEAMVILPVESTFRQAYPTVYLLHGLMGNHQDYLNHTNILQWANEFGLAIVMPNGENSYYVDWSVPHHAYGQLIGEELIVRTRQMFPLSSRPKMTMLAGLSMGGFGALRNALQYPQIFGYVAALSSALNIYEKPERVIMPQEAPYLDLEQGSQTDKDPRWLARQRALQPHLTLPEMFIACGKADPYYDLNKDFAREVSDLGYIVTFAAGEGGHDWNYWDPALKQALDWFYQQLQKQ